MKLTSLDYIQVATPIGDFIVAARDGALKGGWFVGQKYFPVIEAASGWRAVDTPVLKQARAQLRAYFAGELQRFELPMALEGTPFQLRVWHALCAVPSGRTTTYAALAAAIGAPHSFHPVGAAVGRNPLSVIVPCHRALGSDGGLTGYAGGLERKRWLLHHESREADLFDAGVANASLNTRRQPHIAAEVR